MEKRVIARERLCNSTHGARTFCHTIYCKSRLPHGRIDALVSRCRYHAAVLFDPGVVVDQLIAGENGPVILDEQSGPDFFLANQHAIRPTKPNKRAVCAFRVPFCVRGRERTAGVEKSANLSFTLVSVPRPVPGYLTVQDTKRSVAGSC